ncbi:MAG TPA: anaerobic ribonucleoside-triphosphate reductase activating protein [Candidatus Marinimicrobia bacterium]|nr:anaerobic ribonucleoside-triphosphate reductase activating protein [Candidatus Neomarinimicrobiota bacterium]
MIIGGLQKLSLIDFPGRPAAVVFTRGCNFRCPYCHNPELIICHSAGDDIHLRDFFAFLEKRRGLLEGVVVTGGEPTLHDDLPEFMRRIRGLGFAVKLDSNGSNPAMLQKIIDDRLVDYIAMDVKAPFEKYSQVVGVSVDIDAIRASIDIIRNSGLPHQFRTTLAQPLLDRQDAATIQSIVKPSPLQLQACEIKKVLNEHVLTDTQYSEKEIQRFLAAN